MNIIETFIDFVINLDKYLGVLIQIFGSWTYLVLFVIIFCETGLVVFPFFPGDSLIFLCGAFAAVGSFNLELLFVILSLAAIIGDTINYWIGHFLGPKVFKKENARFFKKKYLDDTEKFYEKHGAITIILARFIPIIRTFAPFVAGIGKMSYGKFLTYNIVGGIGWVAIFLLGGYFFGTIPVVKENMTLVIYSIIAISLLPSAVKVIQHSIKK